MWFLSPQPLPGHPPDFAIALEFKLVPSRSVMAAGVTAAKRPAFLRKSRRAWASETKLSGVHVDQFQDDNFLSSLLLA